MARDCPPVVEHTLMVAFAAEKTAAELRSASSGTIKTPSAQPFSAKIAASYEEG